MINSIQNWQIQESISGLFNLPVLKQCSCSACRQSSKFRAGRLINNLTEMATKFRINSNQPNGNATYLAYGDFIDTTNNLKLGASFYVTVDETQYDTPEDEKVAVYSGIVAEASSRSYGGFSTADIQDMVPLLPSTLPMSQAPATRSIVTGTGAVGFQPSATRNVFANYNATIVSTASIAGAAQGTLVLEIAPTNSATAGDWVEVCRFTNGQALSLAITLQSVQTLSNSLSGMIPAGYYAKLRSISTSGSPTFTFNSGQEVLL